MTRGRSYPHEDGDVIVLGPEVFASKDRTVINWKGENYYRRRQSMPGPDVRNIRSSAQAKQNVHPRPKRG